MTRKRPRSFCPKCRSQVIPKHTYTLDPTKSEWADNATDKASCGNPLVNELTRNSLGNTQPQSSQLAKPLWTYTSLKSGISVHELIFTKKKKKKHRRWMNRRTFSPNPCKRGKSHQHRFLRSVLLFSSCLQLNFFFSASLRTNFNEKHSMGVIADNLISTLDKA